VGDTVQAVMQPQFQRVHKIYATLENAESNRRPGNFSLRIMSPGQDHIPEDRGAQSHIVYKDIRDSDALLEEPPLAMCAIAKFRSQSEYMG
jgi:hypothetical protein